MNRAALTALVAFAALTGCRSCQDPPPSPTFDQPVKVNDVDGGWAQAEPALVVDGERLLVAWMDFTTLEPSLRVAARRAGDPFGPSFLIGEGGPDHGFADPSIVRTDDGTVYLSYLECRPHPEAPDGKGCTAQLRRTTDGGETWSEPESLRGKAPREDRPWLATDGQQVFASWTEESRSGPPRWVLASEGNDGRFAVRTELEGKKSYNPVVLTGSSRVGTIEALLVDYNSAPDRLYVSHVRGQRRAPGDVDAPGDAPFPVDFETHNRFEVPTATILMKLSIGTLAADSAGNVYSGLIAGSPAFSTLRGAVGDGGPERPRPAILRAGPAGRVTLPWVAGRDRGFVAAWLEETPAGWIVVARCIDPDGAPTSPVALSPPGPFEAGSRRRFLGDFLDIRVAGPDVWVVWADASDGDADIYLALGRCPA